MEKNFKKICGFSLAIVLIAYVGTLAWLKPSIKKSQKNEKIEQQLFVDLDGNIIEATYFNEKIGGIKKIKKFLPQRYGGIQYK